MARFMGKIGYGISVESSPGVWSDQITEIEYYGDVVVAGRRLDEGQNLNSDIQVGNRISVVADEYANMHFSMIKYVEWSGALWIVTSVEIKGPRLFLTLGGVYNGPTP